MKRATDLIRCGSWDRSTAAGSVTLSFDDRYRRRFKMTTDQGDAFFLDLEKTVRMVEGDGLKLTDGGTILVRAGKEDVLDIRAPETANLTQLAWHLGNRHTPVQVLDGGEMRIRYDHVLAVMIEGLGGKTERRHDVFSPEQGAYSGHGHDH